MYNIGLTKLYRYWCDINVEIHIGIAIGMNMGYGICKCNGTVLVWYGAKQIGIGMIISVEL